MAEMAKMAKLLPELPLLPEQIFRKKKVKANKICIKKRKSASKVQIFLCMSEKSSNFAAAKEFARTIAAEVGSVIPIRQRSVSADILKEN